MLGSDEIRCDICGKTGFKSKSGLVGHKKIAHGADTRKTIPDEMGKRLEAIEKNEQSFLTITERLLDRIEVIRKSQEEIWGCLVKHSQIMSKRVKALESD